MSLSLQRNFDVTLDRETLLQRHKVLRQTYQLLSANLLFSALCAYVGMLMNLGPIHPLLHLIVFFGLAMGVNATRNSAMGVVLLFALTGFLGLALSNILGFLVSANAGDAVVKALIGTAIIFASLSFYVLKTGTNFKFLGGWLFCAGIIGVLALLASVFFSMGTLYVVTCAFMLLVFSGYVLYDTSAIIHGDMDNYIIATMSLFLDIYNIFLYLLQLILASRD